MWRGASFFRCLEVLTKCQQVYMPWMLQEKCGAHFPPLAGGRDNVNLPVLGPSGHNGGVG